MLSLLKKKISDSCIEGRIHSFINPYSYLLLRKNRPLVESVDYMLVDGMAMVIALRVFLGWQVTRVSFDMTSLAARIFDRAVRKSLSICLIGSHADEIEMAVAALKKRFPGMDICEYRDGYFGGSEEKAAWIKSVVSLNPSIVVVGMGTIYQERLLLDLRAAGWRGEGYTCGGFFHQSAKSMEYYPFFFDKFNLRWLYRMYDEPKLIKRYFVDYFVFVFVFVFDVIRYKVKRQ